MRERREVWVCEKKISFLRKTRKIENKRGKSDSETRGTIYVYLTSKAFCISKHYHSYLVSAASTTIWLGSEYGSMMIQDMIPLGLDETDKVNVNLSMNILSILSIDEVIIEKKGKFIHM